MATYNIYLVRLGKIELDDKQQTQAGTLLKGFFDRVIKSKQTLSTRFNEGARVRWMASCPASRIKSHELLVYMVQSVMSAVVSHHKIIGDRPLIHDKYIYELKFTQLP